MNGFNLSTVSGIFLGNTEYRQVYYGSNKLWEKPSLLPYDAELEYLISDGSLYANTGILNDSDVIIDMKIAVEGVNCLNGVEYNTSNRFKWGSDGHGKYYYGFSTSVGTPIGANLDYPVIFHLEQGNQYINDLDGTNITSSTNTFSTFSTTIPIYLFQCYSGNSFSAFNGKMKIYSCSITKDNVVHNIIPVRVGTLGYLYDTATNEFLTNEGNGSYILGPDKVVGTFNSNFTQIEYIDSNQSGAFIDLGIKLYKTLNTDYDIAIKFNIEGQGLNNTSNAFIFGCQDPQSPYPGTFIRKVASSSKVIGRYIGGSAKDTNIGNINTIIELPVQTSPNKNVTNLSNSGKTHDYGTTLFCNFSNKYNSTAGFADVKLYYFKLFVEGVLIRDMVPCIYNATNAAGLYDLVNNKFYLSPNGAAFTAGPTIS